VRGEGWSDKESINSVGGDENNRGRGSCEIVGRWGKTAEVIKGGVVREGGRIN